MFFICIHFYLLTACSVPIYDVRKDDTFTCDSDHLDNIPGQYPLYKKSIADLYPGSMASVLYQYGLYIKPGEQITPETPPCIQLHPILVLVHPNH